MALQSIDTPAAVASEPPALSVGYRRYALGIMLCIYALNFLDRQIVAILAEPIRGELHLADWQIGMMTGLSFALFYTLFGIPVARLAERGNRPLLISVAIGSWSLCTALCGLAQNFVQLVLARIGVGIGESGCTPAAVSLIADYVPKSERATAMSIYSLGSPVGTLIGMAFGGLIAAQWGWRAAFFIAGVPGILLAIVVALTLIEPRRRGLAAQQRFAEQPKPTVREALVEIRKSRALPRIILGGAMIAFVSYGTTAFLGSFFLRNHNAELTAIGGAWGTSALGALGVLMGLMHGVGGGIGSLLGGKLVDHYAKRDLRAYAWLPGAGMLIGVPLFIFAFVIPSAKLALLCFTLALIFKAVWGGPVYAAVQGLVRPELRATTTAILLFTTNLIGLGLGPLLIGLASDFAANVWHLDPAASIKLSLMLFSLMGIPAGIVYWSAARTIREEMVN